MIHDKLNSPTDGHRLTKPAAASYPAPANTNRAVMPGRANPASANCNCLKPAPVNNAMPPRTANPLQRYTGKQLPLIAKPS